MTKLPPSLGQVYVGGVVCEVRSHGVWTVGLGQSTLPTQKTIQGWEEGMNHKPLDLKE